MALYFGSSKEKVKINLNNTLNQLKIFVKNSLIMSSDNYVLKDANGVQLTTKRSE